MKIYIGTSGWQYGDWQEFYPKTLESWAFLPFYVHNFNSVEINVSFYRMVREKTFRNWGEGASREVKDFVFSVKLNNHFTRIQRLKLGNEDIKKLREFLVNARGLGSTLGPILVQLPQGMQQDLDILEKFLQTCKQILEDPLSTLPSMGVFDGSHQWRFAVEFRHKSWLNDQTYSLLKRYNAAFVISDSARWPTDIVKTADFVYIRLHGKPKMFYSLYSEEELKKWAEAIRQLGAPETYLYFNNTMKGHAAENGLMMKRLFG